MAQELAAAVAAGRTAQARSLHTRLTEVQRELPVLNRALKEGGALTLDVVAELRAATMQVGAADRALREALAAARADSIDAWLLARGRTTDALMDALMAAPWERELDLAVVVGPGSAEVVSSLRQRGQKRILSLDTTRAQTVVPPSGDVPMVANFHELELLDAATMLIPFPHPVRARTVAVGGVSDEEIDVIVERVRRTLQTLTEASHELEEAVPFFTKTATRNLVNVVRRPSVATLKGALAGLPAVVVSAGPSLDRNVAQLRGLEGKVVIIAINQVVRGLRRAGVKPDIVVTVDPLRVGYHFEGVQPGEIGTLVLAASVDPSLFQVPAGQVVTFAASPLSESWIYELCGEDASSGSGGTVATAGLKLAAWLGCGPVITIGRDLALDGQRYYADASADGGQTVQLTADGSKMSFASYKSKLRLAEGGGNVEEIERLLASQVFDLKTVPGFFGKPVTTTSLFLYEMDLLREALRALPGVKFINATEGGAFLEGMEHLTLGEALARCSVSAERRHDVAAMLRERLAPVDLAAREARFLEGVQALLADLQATVELARTAAERIIEKGPRGARRREQMLARTRRQLAARSRSRVLISMLVQRAIRTITRRQIGRWSSLEQVAEAEQALYQSIEGTIGELARGIEGQLAELAGLPAQTEARP